MSSNKLARVTKVLTQSLVAIGGSATLACGPGSVGGAGAIPTPNPSASPTAYSFTLSNNTPTTPESFTLPSTGTILNFYGTVTISGATSETVSYYETQGFATGACPVTGKTVIETIELSILTAFTFAPNGSFGANTGLLDTQFTTTATGPFSGEIFQYSNCTVFSPAQSVVSNGGTSYEYPGGGNTSVTPGSYFIEICK